MENMQYSIERMEIADWPEMVEIYRAGIATKIATFETDVPSWETWDKNHIKACRIVARSGGSVVGWAALSGFSKRYCYRGVAEVSIYIAPGQHGRGIGKALLLELIRQAEEAGLWTLEAKILRENTASLALHAKCGFRDVGYRERMGQMDDGKWHDVCVLEYRSKTVG